MKTCDEMTASLFERRARYEEKREKRRKAFVRAAASTCCFCLAAAAGLGIWRGETDDFKTPESENEIAINEIDVVPDVKCNICLLTEDFVPMDKAEANEYYGTNVFPAVPEDLEESEDQQLGIFRRDGGTGQIYWDGMAYNYANDDFSRTLSVAVEKDSLPLPPTTRG